MLGRTAGAAVGHQGLGTVTERIIDGQAPDGEGITAGATEEVELDEGEIIILLVVITRKEGSTEKVTMAGERDLDTGHGTELGEEEGEEAHRARS